MTPEERSALEDTRTAYTGQIEDLTDAKGAFETSVENFIEKYNDVKTKVESIKTSIETSLSGNEPTSFSILIADQIKIITDDVEATISAVTSIAETAYGAIDRKIRSLEDSIRQINNRLNGS